MEVTTSGLRDWSAVPEETAAKVEAYIASRRLTWIWEAEIEGWQFQGRDREEKRIMEAIRDDYDLLAPLSAERRNKLRYHGIRNLLDGIPMPQVWQNLSARRAEPSDNIRASLTSSPASKVL